MNNKVNTMYDGRTAQLVCTNILLDKVKPPGSERMIASANQSWDGPCLDEWASITSTNLSTLAATQASDRVGRRSGGAAAFVDGRQTGHGAPPVPPPVLCLG